MTTFGKKLQEMRRRASMTQEALAAAMKVSRQTITSWESDAALPDSSHLQQLSRLFNVPMDTLLAPSGSLPKLSFSENYDENEVEKIAGLTARASAVVNRFGEHYEVTPLARKIKLNWWQNLVDIFGFGAGAIELGAALGDLPEQYYLLQSETGDALATITKDEIRFREIDRVGSKRRFAIDNYVYGRTAKPIGK